MKISASKKQLAKIISENGGWPRSAEYSAQDGADGQVSFYRSGVPIYNKLAKIWNAPGSCVHMYGSRIEGLGRVGVIKNFHQTILPRDEYFHLYPAPDADGWIEWKGGECPVEFGVLVDVKYRDGHFQTGCRACDRCDTELYATIYWGSSGGAADIIAYRLHKPDKSKSTAVGDDETNLAAKEELEALEFSESPEQRAKLAKIYAPSIEQLAADYRAKMAIAQKAQEEADSHRCGAEAALEELVAAGKALGLMLSVEAPEPELVITDWRDLQVGDVVWIEKKNSQLPSGEYEIQNLADGDEAQPFMIRWNGKTWWPNIENREWRFIRRP